MARVNSSRTSFLGGEISPKLIGRTDLSHYNHAAKEITNFVVQSQGGATRRQGMRFVEETGIGRLIRFVFSQDESYIIKIDRLTSTVRIYNVNTLFATNVTIPYTFASKAKIDEIQFAQSADTLFLVQQDEEPFVIQRLATNTFTSTRLFSLTGQNVANTDQLRPYRDINVTALTLSPNAVSGAIVITSSAPFFVAGHVGAFIKITNNNITGSAEITGFLTSTTVEAAVKRQFGSTVASTDFQEQAWSDFRGWPRTITLFQSRLGFGGNKAQPDTIWFSAANNVFEMDTFNTANFIQSTTALTVADSKNFTIASGEVNEIQWMSSGSRLAVGTLGTEYSVTDVNTDIPSVKAQTYHGSHFTQPARISTMTLFVPRSRKNLREFVFDFDTDVFEATDITLTSEHLYRSYANIFLTAAGFSTTADVNNPKIERVAYQESENILWVIDSFGGLFAMTRDKKQQISAWHFHLPGGILDTGLDLVGVADGNLTDPKVISIETVPNEDGLDELWATVERSIGGVLKFFIERINPEFQDFSNYNKAFYVDASVRVTSGPGANSFSGFSHLNGETVEILDIETGKKFPNVVVSGGNVVLANSETSTGIIAGLGYTSRIRTVPLSDNSLIGSNVGQPKAVDKVAIRLAESRGVKLGREDGSLDTILLNDNTLANDAQQPTFDGVKVVDFPLSRQEDTEAILQIENDGPLPLTILSLTSRYVTNEV